MEPDLLDAADRAGQNSPRALAKAVREDALESALQRVASGFISTEHLRPSEEPFDAETRITAVRRLPACPARYAPFPGSSPEGEELQAQSTGTESPRIETPGSQGPRIEIDERLRAALQARGISRLYTHQAEAATLALQGRHVVVTTPTASGKTLCYNLPVLNAILQDAASRALYLFPTKALAQDQLAELHALSGLIAAASGPEIGIHTYDGDTPQDARRTIRSRAHIVLSNPDMLHSGILPHHPKWSKLFENLRYVVIDELHAYRGVFGSHFANVLRRLQRICRHFGSSPVFICSSATIANPRELAERLTEQPFALVEDSGAPRGEKYFVFVNPPVVNSALGIRRSYLTETRRVAGEFLRRNLQAIVFAQSRLATELLTTYLKDDFSGPPGSAPTIRGYRGGYLPARRREIERSLRDGVVRGVVSTNALELGVDIGALDVAVMAGYPGTIAATWQRAGRAGRRSNRSAAVLVASSAPVDQFVIRHPSYFFDASPEHALINPDNLQILLSHVKCAAFELPFTAQETFGREDVQAILGVLGEAGFVHLADEGQAGGSWHWTSESYPADAISLRSVSSDNFVIVDVTHGADVIGETDFTSGLPTLHPKAIYLIEGRLFQVERLDFDGRKAYVREADCDYYTDAITYTRVSILDEFESAGKGSGVSSDQGLREKAPDPTKAHGEVHVVSRVVGFKKIKFYTNENVGSGELDLPEQQMHTTAYWLTIPREGLARLPLATDDLRDGIVGLSFAMRQVASLLLMCDRHDLGISISSGDEPQDEGDSKIFLYDNYPGGIGFSEPLYRMHRELLSHTRALIADCDCEAGCPTCVGPVGNTGPLAKTAALRILDVLMDQALGGRR